MNRNILVFKNDDGYSYRAKLCDLGGCLIYDPGNPGTDERYQSGTTGWKPPELAGDKKVSPTSDLDNVPFSWPAADAFGLGLLVAYVVLEKEPYRVPEIAEFLQREYFALRGESSYFPQARDIIAATDRSDVAKLQAAQQWMIGNHLPVLLTALTNEVNAREATDVEKRTIIGVLRKTLLETPHGRLADFVKLYHELGGDLSSSRSSR